MENAIDLTPKPKVKTTPDAFERTDAKQECPVCLSTSVCWSSDYPASVEPFASMRVLYCERCGSGFVPGAGELLDRYYSRDYAALNRGDRHIAPAIYFSDEFRLRSKKITRYFNRATRQISMLREAGARFDDVLDYGSGPGYFLFLSKAKRMYAFDPDIESSKYLAYIGAEKLDDLDAIRSRKFDTIVASHSIEHLVPEKLIETLAILINGLSDGGRFLIEVPQGGHSFIDLDTRQDPHTIFFTPEGITRAVEVAGGQIIQKLSTTKSELPRRINPFYRPFGDPFFSDVKGGLTIICERRPEPRKVGWR